MAVVIVDFIGLRRVREALDSLPVHGVANVATYGDGQFALFNEEGELISVNTAQEIVEAAAAYMEQNP